MSERQIDEAIDAAVRDLMNVDADPAFRARVVERLRQPKPHAGFWRPLSVAAAALVVVIGIALMRSGTKPVIEQPVSSVASATPPRPTTEPAAPAIENTPLVARRSPVRATRRPAGEVTHQIARGSLVATVADLPAQEAPAGDVGLAPVGRMTSIEMAPIVQNPIVTPEIAVEPLAPLGQIVIAPLDPRIERD